MAFLSAYFGQETRDGCQFSTIPLKTARRSEAGGSSQNISTRTFQERTASRSRRIVWGHVSSLKRYETSQATCESALSLLWPQPLMTLALQTNIAMQRGAGLNSPYSLQAATKC